MRYTFSRNPVGSDRSDSRARKSIATVYVTSKGIMVEWLSSNRIKRRVAIGSNYQFHHGWSSERFARGTRSEIHRASDIYRAFRNLLKISWRQRSALTLHKHNFRYTITRDRRHDGVNVMNATTLMECSDKTRGEITVYLRTLRRGQ